MLPMLLFGILSFPAWVFWPFLSAQHRESIHVMIEQLMDWTREALHHTKPGPLRNLTKRRPWSELTLPGGNARAVDQQLEKYWPNRKLIFGRPSRGVSSGSPRYSFFA